MDVEHSNAKRHDRPSSASDGVWDIVKLAVKEYLPQRRDTPNHSHYLWRAEFVHRFEANLKTPNATGKITDNIVNFLGAGGIERYKNALTCVFETGHVGLL
jgi:hypothetical protein